MRLIFPNPFVVSECKNLNINQAPIDTYIYETYAQCNEDLIIEAMLRALCFKRNKKMHEIKYIELGGNHPVQTSSTYLLHKIWGANGLIVEANKFLVESLKNIRIGDEIINVAISDSYQKSIVLHVAKGHELSSVDRSHVEKFKAMGELSELSEEILVENMHINDFLDVHVKGEIDYMSIDIEGMDLPVLSAMDFSKCSPNIIQCEHNEKIKDFEIILGKNNYHLIAATDVNAIFVKTEVAIMGGC